jgi:hypothetical protein
VAGYRVNKKKRATACPKTTFLLHERPSSCWLEGGFGASLPKSFFSLKRVIDVNQEEIDFGW